MLQSSLLEHSVSIFIGVAAGVLTALLVSLVNDLWSSALLPFFRRCRYRGPHLAGEWRGLGAGHVPASGQWSEVILTLKQDARDLRGTMVLRDRSAGHSIDLNLRVTGRTSQGHVTLSLWPASRTTRSVATALLKVDSDGGALNGQLLYLGTRETMEVINVSVHLAGSIAAPRLLPGTP